MEWLILLLLVPAIMVPVVLLWGFAGCDEVFKLHRPPEPPVLTATPKSETEIELTWTSPQPGLKFDILRAVNGDTFGLYAKDVPNSPFVDPTSWAMAEALERGVTYNYQVAVRGDDGSAVSEPASARPLAFFYHTPSPGTNEDRHKDCIIQKITGTLLTNWGTVKKIHVRGSTEGDLFLNGIYISGVAPNANPGLRYDSDTDPPVKFKLGVLVKKGESTVVPIEPDSTYEILAPTGPNPLDVLIAFNISADAGQGNVQPAMLLGAKAFIKEGFQEASVANRNNFSPREDTLYLVEKIEVL